MNPFRGKPRRSPVAVPSGFPGAGTTAPLNRMLGGWEGRRVALVVDDMGEVNVGASRWKPPAARPVAARSRWKRARIERGLLADGGTAAGPHGWRRLPDPLPRRGRAA